MSWQRPKAQGNLRGKSDRLRPGSPQEPVESGLRALPLNRQSDATRVPRPHLIHPPHPAARHPGLTAHCRRMRPGGQRHTAKRNGRPAGWPPRGKRRLAKAQVGNMVIAGQPGNGPVANRLRATGAATRNVAILAGRPSISTVRLATPPRAQDVPPLEPVGQWQRTTAGSGPTAMERAGCRQHDDG